MTDRSQSAAAPIRAALALLLALSCVCGQRGAAAEPGSSIISSDAWIRWLPAGLPAGGYVTLRNAGAQPLALTGLSCAAFGEVELHRSVSRNGVSTMEPVAQIPLPAHASVSFAEGGYHIMLEQPTRPLRPGDRVPITLHFSDGSASTVSFEVRAPNAPEPPR